MLKRFLFLITIGLLTLGSAKIIYAQEEITSFDVNIKVNQDGSALVNEKIYYSTQVDKHGIYRYLPINHSQDSWAVKLNYQIIDILDENQKAHPFTTDSKEGSLVIKIGDPNDTFVGERLYDITYLVDRFLVDETSPSQVIWDVTGEGWEIPIKKVNATLESPYTNFNNIKCFSGKFGSNDNQCQVSVESGQITATYLTPISFGSGLTLQAEVTTPNQLANKNSLQKWWLFLQDNYPILLLLIATFLPALLWYIKGRDYLPQSDNIFIDDPKNFRLKPAFFSLRTPMVYQPPKDMSPAEACLALTESVSDQALIAEIVSLAQKRHLEIIRIEKKGLFGKADFEFRKIESSDTGLNAIGKILKHDLFSTGDKVKLSQLKGKFYLTMTKAKSQTEKLSTTNRWFMTNPSLTRGLYIVAFIVILICCVALSLNWLALTSNVYGVLLIPLGIVSSFAFGYNMVQKSALGTNQHLKAKGFKHTLKTGSWRLSHQEANLFIEESLPFAIAFGVVKQLAKQMETLNLKMPEYMAFAGSVNQLSSNLGQFTSTTTSSLKFNPNSSSSSSSGGFSGGGRGGGGGGSW